MKPSRAVVLLGMGIVAMTLSGCLLLVGKIVVEAETERLADLERFEVEVASQDCDGRSGIYADLVSDKDNLIDFDQRSDLVLGAMR